MHGFLVDELAEEVLITADDDLVHGFLLAEGVLTTAGEDGDGVVAGTTAEEEAAGITLELAETAGEDD